MSSSWPERHANPAVAEPSRLTAERVAEAQRYSQLLAMQPHGEDVVPVLLSFLGDPSWRVRKAAVVLLERWKLQPGLVPALLKGLASTDNAGLRNACADALVRLGAVAVDETSAALATPDPDHRKFLVEVLGAIGNEAARDALVSSLDDLDVNVRAAAAESLGRIGGPEVVERLKARLQSQGTDLLQRVYLLDALVRASARLDYVDLEPWIGDAVLARQVCALLGRCADARACSPLLSFLLAPARETRGVAARSLVSLCGSLQGGDLRSLATRLREPHLVAALMALLNDDDDEVVATVVQLLALQGDPKLAPAILAACACRKIVEVGTTVVLGMCGAAVAPLLAAFDTANVETRVLILDIVEHLGGSDAVPALLEIAAGPETRSSEAAVRALGALAGPEAVASLMTLVRRGDHELAQAAALALSAIGRRHPDAVVPPVRAAFEGGESRPEWLAVLAALGREECLQLVLSSAHHRDPELRAAALNAARVFGGPVPLGLLIFALTDEHPKVRVAAARALGERESTPAVHALLAAVRDPDPWVVAEAVRGLGKAECSELGSLVATLKAAAVSNSAPIAIAALQSLFRLNPPGLGAILEKAIGHADPEVAREAITTATRLPEEEARPLLVGALEHRFWSVRSAAAQALVGRRISPPSAMVQARLLAEEEPLVREALERLLSRSAAADGGAPP